jgi:hypothetical protein
MNYLKANFGNLPADQLAYAATLSISIIPIFGIWAVFAFTKMCRGKPKPN